jgi:hypothetical protein
VTDVSIGSQPGVGVREQGQSQPAGEPPTDPLLADDEVTGDRVSIVGQPAVRGAEASRSAQSFAELVSYEVGRGQAALLVEVAASIDGNGEVRMSLPYSDPVRFTGSIDVSLPLDGAVLGSGATVSVSHQSTDGNSATNRATITVKEV